MFQTENAPRVSSCPNQSLSDMQWIPSRFSLFEDVVVSDYIPTQRDIKFQCQKLQLDWDDREKFLRRLRSEMACEFGVCRNQ